MIILEEEFREDKQVKKFTIPVASAAVVELHVRLKSGAGALWLKISGRVIMSGLIFSSVRIRVALVEQPTKFELTSTCIRHFRIWHF